ncbi:YbhB/YbcL family Raf kinase inhibitor-like protein [Spirosoma rigui]|uniref:YbhB/YbcL family Raf kinase inhibitor-like protein n=1 Tax=Spirosoma rigui TaxID=564064 RepID=UPI0009B0EE4D|nr:YbhB/YbcL family Raf kinase inhibitor-like protein [Spirosoma rigui]
MRSLFKILLGLLAVFLLLAIGLHVAATSSRAAEEASLNVLRKTVDVSSSSFPPNGDMPVSCSCKGKELSPALLWESPDQAVESYVVLATDYNVPTPAFSLYNLSHWVVYNLPASVRSLPEGVTAEQLRMLGGKVGKNGMGDTRYIGPCPPVGRHGYVFRVYALDQMLSFTELPGKQDVLDAMQGHVIGYGELTGYFQ